MRPWIWFPVFVVAAVLVLGISGAAALPAVNPARAQGVEVSSVVASKISYQGRLTSPDGTPLSGPFQMQFQLYDAASSGSLLWDSGTRSVDVDHGLFDVLLDVSVTVFNGRAVWLAIAVGGEWLSPRQELTAAPYALSLRPGAQVSGPPTAWDGWVLKSNMEGANPSASGVYSLAATGSAVRGESTGGYGVFGYTQDGYAVYGNDAGTTNGRGYGGYFASTNGVGVYGRSDATRSTTNDYAPGVYGRSARGTGVYGVSDSTSTLPGVRGESTIGTGVYGSSSNSYGGSFYSTLNSGLRVSGATDTYAAVIENRGSLTGPGLYVYGTLVASGSKSGYVVDVAINDGPEALETGDLVEIVGWADPVVGEIPVIRVREATAGSTAIAGVVDQPFNVPQAGMSASSDLQTEKAVGPRGARAAAADGTAVVSGEYLSVVTHGAFKAIKVDATQGAVKPGTLLVASDNPGYAAAAPADARVGTVVGKAMEGQSGGTGTIKVLVTLQ